MVNKEKIKHIYWNLPISMEKKEKIRDFIKGNDKKNISNQDEEEIIIKAFKSSK